MNKTVICYDKTIIIKKKRKTKIDSGGASFFKLCKFGGRDQFRLIICIVYSRGDFFFFLNLINLLNYTLHWRYMHLRKKNTSP